MTVMTQERPVDGRDDWDLLAEIASGGHDAFREVFSRYGKAVFGFINKRVAHRETAEDLCQDVFIRLWEKASFFEKREAKFSSLLFGIAKKVVQEYWRSVGVEREKMKQVGAEQEAAQPLPETRDLFYQIALDELSNPGNWRKGQPLPNLAFHLAVYRRRQAGVEPQKLYDMERDSKALKGPAVVRRYLWLRLWASGKEISPDAVSVRAERPGL